MVRVKLSKVIEGCILSSDVISFTNTPIIPKKTVLNQQYLEILHAFLIKEVEVEPTLVNGDPFKVDHEDIVDEEVMETSFSKKYLNTVKGYKKLFNSWQAGVPINMPELRNVLVTFLESSLESPNEIFKLHHYSTREEYIFHHAVSVAALSSILAQRLQFQKGDCIQIGLAGALCDSGMAKIDPKIINKQGSLTEAEFEEVKKHPQYSYNMLKQVTVIKDSVRQAVVQHHERIDGSGYPLGLNGDKLHPFSKIIAVADMFHAMTSERHYRSKQSPFKVLEAILQDSFGLFDLRVVQALTKALANFSTGTRVRLSNNQVGEIVFIEQKSPTRPMIKLSSGEIIQLINHNQLFIDEIIN